MTHEAEKLAMLVKAKHSHMMYTATAWFLFLTFF